MCYTSKSLLSSSQRSFFDGRFRTQFSKRGADHLIDVLLLNFRGLSPKPESILLHFFVERMNFESTGSDKERMRITKQLYGCGLTFAMLLHSFL